MTEPSHNLTLEELFRARGIDPKVVKFGRLVGPGTDDPFKMSVKEFERAAIGGRALDAADLWFVGFETHHARVASLPEEPCLRDLLVYAADIEVSLVHLLRLRRAAVLLHDHVQGCEELLGAVRDVDSLVPDLKHLRDTQEHFDDYILGKGRHKPKAGTDRTYGHPADRSPIVQRGPRQLDLG